MQTIILRAQRDWRIFNLSRKVAAKTRPDGKTAPVVMFNASTRLGGLSQNAAFSMLVSWGLQLADVPVVHFACRSGMSRCVLGTNPDDPAASPPCARCVAQSRRVYASAPVRWFGYQAEPSLAEQIAELNLDALSAFEFDPADADVSFNGVSIPLGKLVIPSLRWTLRKHHLNDDEATRSLLREYILSAWRVALEFDRFLDETQPQCAIVFNGLQFPEAAAKWVCRQRGVRVLTFEVGFMPFSAFFSDGEATAYPMEIPDDFELSERQNSVLDTYLSKRFKGDFTMAGIRFWQDIKDLDGHFLSYATRFEQVVPVFTNVIFDTSQIHANVVYPHMFAWLDGLLRIFRSYPETLFVIRAHPDEKRPNSGKQSRESVSDWVERNRVREMKNVLFYDSTDYINSYELIKLAKFIAVYNSSIGLEASILGKPVLCAGKARYTQIPVVFFPKTSDAYEKQFEMFLKAETVEHPPEFTKNARRFLYYQLYRYSLPFDRYLTAHPTPGYVQLKRFSRQDLMAYRSETMRVILRGVLGEAPFLLPDEQEN